jgi:hypothetical protein
MPKITRALLEDLTRQIGETVTHPRFLEDIQRVRQHGLDTRLAAAKEVADARRLSAAGVPLPPGFRVTTREFEDPEDARSLEFPYGTEVHPVVEYADGRGTVTYVGYRITVQEATEER